MEGTRDTRIVIDGDTGAGKTTFIKRLCYIWAENVLHPGQDEKENKALQKYSFVIPIILRFLTHEKCFLDVLTAQLQVLNICEICSLLKCIEENPGEILLLFDGFDEYTGTSVIEKIISHEEYSNILCITTSRYHAIEQLRRKTSQAISHHIRLCGFNEEQVKLYITQFCKYHGIPFMVGKNLIVKLTKERRDILELAKVPIRTEMICIVWSIEKKLGKTLSDLYEFFVKHLIAHHQKKRINSCKTLAVEEIERRQEILLTVGKLANTWERYNRLKILFDEKELQLCLPSNLSENNKKDMFSRIVDIGLIGKSHPSNVLKLSKWSFNHLSIQEYFVAYFLKNTTNDVYVKEFIERCRDQRVLFRSEMILMFLCSIDSDLGSHILNSLLQEPNDEIKFMDLLKFLSKVLHKVTHHSVSLPWCVNVKLLQEDYHEQCHCLDTLNSLLESEKRNQKPNLHSLTLCNILGYKDFMDLTYLKKLDLSVKDQNELLIFKEKIQHLKALESLTVQSDISFTNVDLASNVPTKNLMCLSVTGPGAMKAAADHIQRFTLLQQLHIDDTSAMYDKEAESNLITKLKRSKTMKQVSLCASEIDEMLLKKDLSLKVKTLRKGTLGRALRDMNVSDNLHKLDLRENNLEQDGNSLGKLICKMTALRILCIGLCSLNHQTLKAIVTSIKTTKKKEEICQLHTLSMEGGSYKNNNNFHSGGTYLGELIALLPQLEILGLAVCRLVSSDLNAMNEALPQNTKIQTLNMMFNDLGDTNGGGVRLFEHLRHLQAVKAGGSQGPDPTQALCKAAEAGSLTSLQILDISYSRLKPDSLKELSQHLSSMSNIKVINLENIRGVKSEDFKFLFENIPKSARHLNVNEVWSIKMDPYLVLENKENLKHLKRLNIELSDNDIEFIQEQLELHNPDIHVYNDVHEYVWKAYVLDQYQG